MKGYSRGLGLVASEGSKETQSSDVWLKSELVLGKIFLQRLPSWLPFTLNETGK